MGIGPHDAIELTLFGLKVRQAFGHTAYQVGSSLTQKSGWRDVDVRLLLPDDEYTGYFGDWRTKEHNAPRLAMWEFAWTMAGRHTTRLPIDFQIQPVELANENYPGVRSALIWTSGDEMREAMAAADRTSETTAEHRGA